MLERKILALESIKEKSKQSLKVGVPAAAGIHKDDSDDAGDEDLTVAQIAAWNEFGTEDGRVPERSFLRSTISVNHDKYKLLFKKITARLIDDPELYIQLLSKIGFVVQGDVQKTIRDLIDPPNSPKTIAAKKSDNPLVDTGQLGSSITFVIDKVKV